MLLSVSPIALSDFSVTMYYFEIVEFNNDFVSDCFTENSNEVKGFFHVKKKMENLRTYFVVIMASMIFVLSNLQFLSLENILGDSIFQVTLRQKQRNISNRPLLLHVNCISDSKKNLQ